MKNKRICSILLVFIMCISLCTGCNIIEIDDMEVNTKKINYQEYLTDEVSLDFECIWVGTDSKAQYIQKMVDSFNEEYAGKYYINMIRQTDYDTYESKLKIQIGAGQVPDIFTVKNYSDVEAYAQTGKLMDFTSYLSSKNRILRYEDGIFEEYKINGAQYCIPYESGVVPIMFNGTLLESCGITKIPTSWEEFFACCDVMKQVGMTPVSFMTGANAWTAQLWFSYALASVAGKDAWSVDIESEEFKEAAKIVKKLYSYAPSDAIGAAAGTVNTHFYNKETAIYTNGAWILGGIKSNAGQAFYDNVKVSSGLSYNGKNGNSFISYVQAFLCVAEQIDSNKKAAVEAFIDYITDTTRVTELSESSGATFCINADASKLTDPLQSDIIAKCNNASFTIKSFGSSVSAGVQEAFPKALERYLIGEITVEEFVSILAKAQ